LRPVGPIQQIDLSETVAAGRGALRVRFQQILDIVVAMLEGLGVSATRHK
jgi:hypothetical protein